MLLSNHFGISVIDLSAVKPKLPKRENNSNLVGKTAIGQGSRILWISGMRAGLLLGNGYRLSVFSDLYSIEARSGAFRGNAKANGPSILIEEIQEQQEIYKESKEQTEHLQINQSDQLQTKGLSLKRYKIRKRIEMIQLSNN